MSLSNFALPLRFLETRAGLSAGSSAAPSIIGQWTGDERGEHLPPPKARVEVCAGGRNPSHRMRTGCRNRNGAQAAAEAERLKAYSESAGELRTTGKTHESDQVRIDGCPRRVPSNRIDRCSPLIKSLERMRKLRGIGRLPRTSAESTSRSSCVSG